MFRGYPRITHEERLKDFNVIVFKFIIFRCKHRSLKVNDESKTVRSKTVLKLYL